jgi:hypothetical protein
MAIINIAAAIYLSIYLSLSLLTSLFSSSHPNKNDGNNQYSSSYRDSYLSISVDLLCFILIGSINIININPTSNNQYSSNQDCMWITWTEPNPNAKDVKYREASGADAMGTLYRPRDEIAFARLLGGCFKQQKLFTAAVVPQIQMAASVSGDGPALVQVGAVAGDVLCSADGTRLRLITGVVRASRSACARRCVRVRHGAPTDDLRPEAGIGQSCCCGNPWPRCNHRPLASFTFLSVGSKIRKICQQRGTDPEALLRKEPWEWKDALTLIKGESNEAPPWMQLRRTIFTVEVRLLLQYLTIARAAKKGPLYLSGVSPPHWNLGWEGVSGASPPHIGFRIPRSVLVEIRAFLLGPLAPRPRRLIRLTNDASLLAPESSDLHFAGHTRVVPGIDKEEAQLAWYPSYPSYPDQESGVEVASVSNLIGTSEREKFVWSEISALNPSQLKSFMQKLVRWGSAVDVADGDLALRAAFVALFFGPGMFLPDLRQHSTGPRLALQRLVVILFEDGVAKEDVGDLTYWAALAGVLQHTPTPVPLEVVRRALGALSRARRSPYALAWRRQPRRLVTPTGAAEPPLFSDLHAVFAAIGAMAGDLKMILSVRRLDFQGGHLDQGDSRACSLAEARFKHLDQHAEPLIPHVVALFLWHVMTGFNPRTAPETGPMARLDWAKLGEMAPAQKRALEFSLGLKPEELGTPLDAASATHLIPFRCEASAIVAYSAGQITVTVKKMVIEEDEAGVRSRTLKKLDYLAVFCPSDLDIVVILRKPQARAASADVDHIDPKSDEYEDALEALRRKRIPLGSPLEPGKYLRWDKAEEQWKTSEPLPDSALVPVHPAEDPDPRFLPSAPTGGGLREKHEEVLAGLFALLPSTDRTEVVRMLADVTPGCDIEMTPLLRSARPTGMRHAVYAFVGTIAHQCPGALTPTSAGKWHLNNPVVFAHVRHKIIEWFVAGATPTTGWRPAPLAQPHAEQKHCLDRIHRWREKRHFVMAKTGAGKSLIAALLCCEAANEDEIDHVFVFMDSEAGLTSVATEMKRCIGASFMWLDSRAGGRTCRLTTLPGGAEAWVEISRGAPAPVLHAVNVLRYDHFAQNAALRAAVISKASTGFAVYDEVDRCYGETLRTRICVPLAFLFRRLVMLTATPLRKHAEGIGPRLAIASLFAPFPLSAPNLLVFFCGHVKSFEHPIPYPEVHDSEYIELRGLADTSLQPDSGARFAELADLAFLAALPRLLEAGRQLVARAGGPVIVAVQTKKQVQWALEAGRNETQEPTESRPPSRPLVVVAASAVRGRNFGRHTFGLLHLPLAISVPTRRQLYGRLHRGPLRKLHYLTVIPKWTVLEALYRNHERDEYTVMNLEALVRQARTLEERARSRLCREIDA